MLKWISIAGIALSLTAAGRPALAQDCESAGTVGSAGSATAGGTSASTIGTAGTCLTDAETTSSIGSAGSASSTDGKATSKTKVIDNPSQLKRNPKHRLWIKAHSVNLRPKPV